MGQVCKITELTDRQCADIADVYVSSGYGSEYAVDRVRRWFAKTTYALFLVENDGRIVAVLRALSDNEMTTWLAELVVRKGHPYHESGRLLLRKFAQDFSHTAIYTELLTGMEDPALFEEVGIVPARRLVAYSRRWLS